MFAQLVEEDDDAVLGHRLSTSGKGACCCCTTVGFITLLLCLLSIDTVEPLQYGLNYSTWSKSISDKTVYTSGRHFLGLGHAFVTFPRTKQLVVFSTLPDSTYGPIRAKTGRGEDNEAMSNVQGGGLNVTLSVSLQYRFKREHLHRLYNDYKLNYDAPFRLEFEETFRQVASSYTQFDYWKNLDAVLLDMRSRLRESADSLHIEFVSVQLLELVLDTRVEDALIRTQVEQERKKRAEFELQVEAITQEKAVIEADAEAKVRVLNATAHAEEHRIVEEAEAQARANLLHAQAHSFRTAQHNLAMDADGLLSYVWYKTLEEKRGAKVFVDLHPQGVVGL